MSMDDQDPKPPAQGPDQPDGALPSADRKPVKLPRKGLVKRAGGTIIRLAARRKQMSKRARIYTAVATILGLLVVGGGVTVLMTERVRPWERRGEPRRSMDGAGVGGIQSWMLVWATDRERKKATEVVKDYFETDNPAGEAGGQAIEHTQRTARAIVKDNGYERALRIIAIVQADGVQLMEIDPQSYSRPATDWRQLLAIADLVLRLEDDKAVRLHFTARYGPWECDLFIGHMAATAEDPDEAQRILAPMAARYLGVTTEFHRLPRG